jgi:putative ATP-dependent DNA ligase
MVMSDASLREETAALSPELSEVVEQARRAGRARLEQIAGHRYVRFVDAYHGVAGGTVVYGDDVVLGYPKIGRILRLDTGIRAQFERPFWVEDKVDGYNVRVFSHGGEVLGVTRRGFVCPFTTDRVPDLLDTAVFDARPDLVLCAEVAGPDNPYNQGHPPEIVEDVRLFVFDLMQKGRAGFLPHREKTRLLAELGLPGVTQHGLFGPEDLQRLAALLRELDRSGREGVVLKEDSERDHRAKYVTGRINLADIRICGTSIKQLPADYFMHRILRLALFMDEHGIERTEGVYAELGKALIEGAIGAAHQQMREHKVYHRFRCRFRQRENAELLLRSLHRLLHKGQVRKRRLERVGDFYLLEFDKILPKTTGLFAHLLSGGIVFD